RMAHRDFREARVRLRVRSRLAARAGVPALLPRHARSLFRTVGAAAVDVQSGDGARRVTDLIPRYDAAMRRSAHELVDALFDHVEHIDERKVVDWKPADELREVVRIGEGGGDLLATVRPLLAQA